MYDFSGRFSSFEDLLIGTTTWQTWVGSIVEAALRARVTWPFRAAALNDYPYINLSPGKGSIGSATGGYGSSANFQVTGSLMLRIWDDDADVDDPQTSFETFDGNVSDLLTDIIDAAHDGPLIITRIEADEPAIVHSHDNAFYLGESAGVTQPVWMSAQTVFWGIPA
jgi:hypothetical protein